MFAALMVVAPLGLAGALSPVMLTEQTVILAGRDGRRAGLRYAAGVMLTSVVVVLAILLFGHSIALPRRPHLDASLDIVLGLVLLGVAGAARALPGRRDSQPQLHRSRLAQAAFPFGVFSMATNVTTLALLVPAAKEISTADVGLVGRTLLVVVLVGLASLPASMPVLLTKLAPRTGRRALDAVQELIAHHGRTMVVALLVCAGAFFAARGVIRLLF